MADRSNLVPQIITNSKGIQTTVWVSPEQRGILTDGNPLTAVGTPTRSSGTDRLSLSPEERKYTDEIGAIENVYEEAGDANDFAEGVSRDRMEVAQRDNVRYARHPQSDR